MHRIYKQLEFLRYRLKRLKLLLAGCLTTFPRTFPKWISYRKLESCQTSSSVSATVIAIRVRDTETVLHKRNVVLFEYVDLSIYLSSVSVHVSLHLNVLNSFEEIV